MSATKSEKQKQENESKIDKTEKKDNKNESKKEEPQLYKPLSPLEIPLWSKLRTSKNVLISGCGGYDCYQGIPLYYAIKTLPNIKNVYIGNYTLTQKISSYKFDYVMDSNKKKKLFYKVNYKKYPNIKAYYFPEYCLSRWFYENEKNDVTIYTFDRWGIKYLKESYELLVKELNIDCIICVDGGTDSLMDGTEHGTGTICEDYISMFSINLIENKNVKNKIHCVLGLGVDRFHGTSDVSSWRAISEITKSGGYLGGITLMNEMIGVKKYRSASEFASKYMQQSIVGSSILDSITGHFGNYHSNLRTHGSKLFINPSMGIYFTFNLNNCCQRIHKNYLKAMINTETDDDAGYAVAQVRHSLRKTDDILIDDENFPVIQTDKHGQVVDNE